MALCSFTFNKKRKVADAETVSTEPKKQKSLNEKASEKKLRRIKYREMEALVKKMIIENTVYKEECGKLRTLADKLIKSEKDSKDKIEML